MVKPYDGVSFSSKKEIKYLDMQQNERTLKSQCEKSQIKKTICYMIFFIQNVHIGKVVETEGRLVFAKGWGRGHGQ